MVKVTESIFVDPKEVCSIENDYANSYYGNGAQKGVVLTLKCGRKIYVPKLSAVQVHCILANKNGTKE